MHFKTDSGLSKHILGWPDTFSTVRTDFGRFFQTGFQRTMTQNLLDGPKSSGWQCYPATGLFRPLLKSSPVLYVQFLARKEG